MELAESGVKYKLVMKASFIAGAELETLDVVVESRMSRKNSPKEFALSLDLNQDLLLLSTLIRHNHMIS